MPKNVIILLFILRAIQKILGIRQFLDELGVSLFYIRPFFENKIAIIKANTHIVALKSSLFHWIRHF